MLKGLSLLAEPSLIEAMAGKIIRQHGSKSLAKITEHCQMANAIGDQPSLQTWRELGAAVQRLQTDADLSAGGIRLAAPDMRRL